MEIKISSPKIKPLLEEKEEDHKDKTIADTFQETELKELKEALCSGFLSVFTFADFFMCSLILKTFLAGNAPIESTEAAAYMTGFYSITVFAMNVGVIDSQGIYCA